MEVLLAIGIVLVVPGIFAWAMTRNSPGHAPSQTSYTCTKEPVNDPILYYGDSANNSGPGMGNMPH